MATKTKPGKGALVITKENSKELITLDYGTLRRAVLTLRAVNHNLRKQIITLPLRIADEKNETYKISSYQFAYKRIGVTEDEETGKLSPQSDMVAQRFTETPLPELWKSNIIEQLHKGEELYFFDIIMLDKTGRLFFAPDLKITIE